MIGHHVVGFLWLAIAIVGLLLSWETTEVVAHALIGLGFIALSIDERLKTLSGDDLDGERRDQA